MVTLNPTMLLPRMRNFLTLIKELTETLLLAGIIFIALNLSVQNFRVEGPSMEPTLETSQYILVNKVVYFTLDGKLIDNLPFVSRRDTETVYLFHPPRRGEIVVFHPPEDSNLDDSFLGDTKTDWVKRVIGLPGDTLEGKKGQIYVNGESLNEPWIQNAQIANFPSTVVPNASYFLIGDNRYASTDSRIIGPIPKDDIVGKAWLSFWPISMFSIL